MPLAVRDFARLINAFNPAKPMPIARYKIVASAKELLQSRNAVHPSKQVPRRKPAVNLVHSIRSDIDLTASVNEAQAGVEVRPGEDGEPLFDAGRLARQILKAAIAVKAANAADAPQAEAAFAVVHDYGTGFVHISKVSFVTMSIQQKR